MNLYDTDSALNIKRMRSNYQKAELIPSQMGDDFGKRFTHYLETEYSAADYYNLLDDYDNTNKEIEDKFGITLPNPLIDDMREEIAGDSFLNNFFYSLSRSAETGTPSGSVNIQSYKEQIEWWNKKVAEIVEQNPNVEFKNLNYFTEETKQKAQTSEFLIGQMNRANRTFMEKYGKSSLAGMSGYLLDPVFLQTLPLSFAYSVPRGLGGAMLKTAVMEGALETGRMGIIQASVQPYRKQLGLSYGIDQALMNMLMAGLGGAVFAPATIAAFRGVGVGARYTTTGVKKTYLSIDEMISKKFLKQRALGQQLNKILDSDPQIKTQPLHIAIQKLNDQDLLDIFEGLPSIVKDHPDYQMAAYNLRQAIQEQNQNPYKPGAEGEKLHSQNTKSAMNKTAVDEKIDVVDSPTVKTKQSDLQKEIELKEAEIKALESAIEEEDLLDIPTFLKRQKNKQLSESEKLLNKARKELKELKKIEKKLEPKLPQSLEAPKEPKVETFLQWLKKNKIDSQDADINEVGAILDKSTFGYTKKGGMSLDQVLTKAREEGWLPPKPEGIDDISINDLLDLMSDNPIHPRHADEIAKYNAEVDGINQQIQMLEEAGYDPMKMSDVDVEIAMQKIANKVDDTELKIYGDEKYLDEAYDNNFDEVMDFFDSKVVDENADIVMALDEDGQVTQTMKAKDIKEEIQADKKALNELSKCKGLDV
mgnify:CR=1 FL=1